MCVSLALPYDIMIGPLGSDSENSSLWTGRDNHGLLWRYPSKSLWGPIACIWAAFALAPPSHSCRPETNLELRSSLPSIRIEYQLSSLSGILNIWLSTSVLPRNPNSCASDGTDAAAEWRQLTFCHICSNRWPRPKWGQHSSVLSACCSCSPFHLHLNCLYKIHRAHWAIPSTWKSAEMMTQVSRRSCWGKEI